MKKLALMLAVISTLTVSVTANAALTQNGNGTFTDTSTGYQWQNISTFFGVDTSAMSSLLLSGFHFADLSELNTLQAAAPAISSNFFSDAAAMGVPAVTKLNRSLIWGVYGDFSQYSWKYASDNNNTWNFSPNNVSGYTDMGAFAVNTAPVPEPETYGMMLLGLGLMGFIARRRKSNQA